MSPLFGPILAQLVTLGVSDRTEARHVVTDDSYSEAGTYPRVSLNFGWKHATLSLGYGPSLTLTPLEAKDPSLVVFHSASVSMSNRWQRTTVAASESLSYGNIDFRTQALAAPGTAPVTSVPGDMMGLPAANSSGGTTTPPANGGAGAGTQPQPGANGAGANQFRASDRIERFASSVSAVAVTQAVSAVLTVSGGVSYMVTGNPSPGADNPYPTVQGPGARLALGYTPTHVDTLTTSLSTQYAVSSAFELNGVSIGSNRAWLLFANESWSHQLDKSTTTTFGAGLSLTRNSQPGPLIYYSIYPNFVAGISHASLLGRSTLTLGLNASSAPYLDPVLAVVDPRISGSAFVGFHRDRFSSTLAGGTALSLATQGNTGALSGVFAAFGVSYVLGTAVTIDSGVRGTYQTFQGQTTIPLSFAAYVGLTFGAQVPLNGTH